MVKVTHILAQPEAFELIRNVSFSSSGTVTAAWNRVRLVNARPGPGFLDFEGVGAAYFRHDFLCRHRPRERVAGDRAPGASTTTIRGAVARDLD